MVIKKLRIRLLGIDTPELKQHFGYESSFYLNKILNGKSVTIISSPDKNKPYTLGYYKRSHRKSSLNGRDINLEMIKKGMAWHFKKYKKSQPIDERHSYNKLKVRHGKNILGYGQSRIHYHHGNGESSIEKDSLNNFINYMSDEYENFINQLLFTPLISLGACMDFYNQDLKTLQGEKFDFAASR